MGDWVYRVSKFPPCFQISVMLLVECEPSTKKTGGPLPSTIIDLVWSHPSRRGRKWVLTDQ